MMQRVVWVCPRQLILVCGSGFQTVVLQSRVRPVGDFHWLGSVPRLLFNALTLLVQCTKSVRPVKTLLSLSMTVLLIDGGRESLRNWLMQVRGYDVTLLYCDNNNNRFTTLCPGLPGWAGTRRNTHPPTVLIIIQSLSASSIYHDP